MAFLDDNTSSASDQNQVSADNPNTGNKKPDSPPRRSVINSDNYRPDRAVARYREGIVLSFIKSILSFRKYNIIYKKIITDDLNTAAIKQLGAENIEIIASFLHVPKNSVEYLEIKDRLAKGCLCYALIENSMMSLTWVFRNKYRIGSGDKMLSMRPDEALIAETILGESSDDSKARMLEDGAALLQKQQGFKPLIFAHRGDNSTPVYSLYQIRFLGLKFTVIRANLSLSPLGFR